MYTGSIPVLASTDLSALPSPRTVDSRRMFQSKCLVPSKDVPPEQNLVFMLTFTMALNSTVPVTN